MMENQKKQVKNREMIINLINLNNNKRKPKVYILHTNMNMHLKQKIILKKLVQLNLTKVLLKTTMNPKLLLMLNMSLKLITNTLKRKNPIRPHLINHQLKSKLHLRKNMKPLKKKNNSIQNSKNNIKRLKNFKRNYNLREVRQVFSQDQVRNWRNQILKQEKFNNSQVQGRRNNQI